MGGAYTKEQREDNWKKCQRYIERTDSLYAAKALAKKEGVRFPTAIWITALGRLLMAKGKKGRDAGH